MRVFCGHFGLAREKIVKNYICYAEGCVTGVKINYVSKNSFSNLLIRVTTVPSLAINVYILPLRESI